MMFRTGKNVNNKELGESEKIQVRILQLIEGAKDATGITVIIDVFRAFSVEAYFMALGAQKVIPDCQCDKCD